MKKYLKVMLVLVVALSLLCTFALAENPFAAVVKDSQQSSSTLSTAVTNVGASAINIVRNLGYIIAVIMVVVVGIQWLIGTPAKKQELKGRLINVIVGAILIACGVTILGFISTVGDDIGNDIYSSVELSTRA